MTRYLSLAEFWYLAEQVTGLDAGTLINASRIDLADSALHAPQAGFDDTDFYPGVLNKAAVLACRIAWNHPLPDGNKRAAWASMGLFLDLNGYDWVGDRPDTDEAVATLPSQEAKSTKHRSQPGSKNESFSGPITPIDVRLTPPRWRPPTRAVRDGLPLHRLTSGRS